MNTLKLLNKYIAASFLIIFLTRCDFLYIKTENKKKPIAEKPIAKVNQEYLYKSDLEGIVQEGFSNEDSTKRVNRYIKNWVRKQLLIHEAKSKIDFDEADLERKILNYRYSLIAYKYKTYYISQHINKNVSEDEIMAYYKLNQDNFPLKQNIIRGKFIKLSLKNSNLDKIKKLILSEKEKDVASLQEYCFNNALNYTLIDTVWINYDDLVKGSPFSEIPNKTQFLRNKKYAETSDQNFKYFLKIVEYKKTDDIAPLNIVKNQIVNIIINKRKVALAKRLEKKIYNEAKKQHLFKIYK